MEPQIVKIISTTPVTHNVKRFTVERPGQLDFVPGQAADLSINHPDWKDLLRPFTFTGLPDWDHIEFTIKIYPDHHGVTEQLGKLKSGDELILHDVFGAIHYYDKGMFIAGGAGVTPFIAILRQLKQQGKLAGNTLLFSNNKMEDIILKDEFSDMLGDRFINTLSQEKVDGYYHGIIDEQYLRDMVKDFNQYFYLCGPDPMVEDIQRTLHRLGAPKEKVIVEQF